jgi:Branched-chain amino acid transport protein (AzlD)
MTDLWPYIVLILVGFLPNEVWRMLGIVVAHGIAEDSELIVWVRAVATAILGGVVAKIVIFAPGALAAMPLGVRLVAMAVGVLAFVLARRSVLADVATGVSVLMLGTLAFGG